MLSSSICPQLCALAIHRGNPQEAIESLRVASGYEQGTNSAMPPMITVYIRGQAYLAAHQGAEAAVGISENSRPSRNRLITDWRAGASGSRPCLRFAG